PFFLLSSSFWKEEGKATFASFLESLLVPVVVVVVDFVVDDFVFEVVVVPLVVPVFPEEEPVPVVPAVFVGPCPPLPVEAEPVEPVLLEVFLLGLNTVVEPLLTAAVPTEDVVAPVDLLVPFDEEEVEVPVPDPVEPDEPVEPVEFVEPVA